MENKDKLKRLEAENKAITQTSLDRIEYCKKLEAEKEEWMLKCAEKDNDIEILYTENARLKAECDMYKTFYRAKHNDIEGKLLKYYNSLQEIKEIAEETIIVYTHIAKLKPELKALDLRSRMQQILQKISEVME